jgi:glutathione S-transferase
MKLIIGNQNYSSWSLRPWILLKYFTVNFDQQLIKLFTDNTLEEMSDCCPNNKVPVLIDNNIKIWDSLAICEYINEQYLANKGWPRGVSQRAQARAICAEMHTGFFALRNEMPMNCRRVPSVINYSGDCQKDIDRIIAIWQQCLDNINGDFLFGEFTIADAFYLPIVSRLISYQVVVPKNINAYMNKMTELPDYQFWLAASHREQEVISYSEV